MNAITLSVNQPTEESASPMVAPTVTALVDAFYKQHREIKELKQEAQRRVDELVMQNRAGLHAIFRIPARDEIEVRAKLKLLGQVSRTAGPAARACVLEDMRRLGVGERCGDET